MHWWAWIVVGAILLVSEMTYVNAQLYLVFVGVAALLVGLLQLAGLGLAVWLQWLIFAILAITSMVFFRRRIYLSLRGVLPVVRDGLVGETLIMHVDLPPGETTRVDFRGSTWNVTNGGQALIAAGKPARVQRIEALALVVRGD